MELADIVGYEGLYQADIKGDIYSKKRSTTKGGKLKKSIRNKYYTVCLCKNGKKKSYKVNRLIALTFIPNPYNKPEVNHIDCNKLNDEVSNLEWNTSKENTEHAFKNGLRNRSVIFSDDNCICMYKTKDSLNKKNIAKQYNINLATVYRAIKKGEELTIK